MMIRKASYGNMDWVKALEAAKKPVQKELSEQNEADYIENALEATASIAFGIPAKDESKREAMARASKEIADKAAEEHKFAASNEIRAKLSEAGIDPVALKITVREANGVQRPITKEEWEGASDARWVNKIATEAALEYEHQAKIAWENEAMQPSRKLSSKYDPETMMGGRIMSAAGASDDTVDHRRQIPANANSIFDPFKLDRFATAENAHDKAVAEKRQAAKDRIQEKKADLKPQDLGPAPMKAGAVQRSGGEDRDVFQQRAPSNKISMTDLQGTEKLTAEEMKEKLASLFTRVDDNGEKIRAGNAERKASIQSKKEEKKSWNGEWKGNTPEWEKLSKPTSTAELTKRLMDAFTCPKPDGK